MSTSLNLVQTHDNPRAVVRRSSSLNLAVGRRIKRERNRQKLSLAEVYHRSGLSISLLSQIERGESSASLLSLYLLSIRLGCEMSTLLPSLEHMRCWKCGKVVTASNSTDHFLRDESTYDMLEALGLPLREEKVGILLVR